MSVKTRSRSSFALLRLFLLYAIFCYWAILAGLWLRDWREHGKNLDAVPIDRANPAAKPPFLGITVQLEALSPPQRKLALQRLRESGFGWVRQRLDWGEIERSPGHFDWQQTDALLDSITVSQIEPVIVLDGSPLWSRHTVDQPPDAPNVAPPADPRNFASFAAEFARRYGERVRYYQLWDEPNIAPHWGKRWVDPIEYAQLLIAASRAIRANDSDAAILTAALAPTGDRGQLAVDEVYFLQRMIAAGATHWFDAIAIQPLGFGHAPTDSRQSLQQLNFQRAALIRRAMLESGIGEKPIWAVRFGWNTRLDSSWATVTAENQQRYTLDALHLAQSNWQWLSALGWAIDQPNAAQDDPVWGFALNERMSAEIGRLGDWRTFPHLPISPPPHLQRFLILGFALLLILWRTVAAVSELHWQTWHAALRSLHFATLWFLLIVVYYLATWTPLIGLCWILAAGLIALCPQIGVGLAVATLPFYFQHKEITLVDSVLTVPPSLALAICLLPSIVHKIWRESSYNLPLAMRNSQLAARHSPFDLLAFGWLLINLLSLFNVWNGQAYRSGLLEIGIQPLVLYVAIRLFVRKETEQQRVLIALVFGGALVAGYGLFDWLGGGGVDVDGVRRLVGPYFSPNHAALYLLRSCFVAVAVLMGARTVKLPWLAVSGLLLIGLLLTASRGAILLGLPVGVLLLWICYSRSAESACPGAAAHTHVRMPWGMGIVILGGIIVLCGIIALSFGWQRLSNSATLLSRLEIWRAAFALWQHFPFLGVGANGFFWNYPAWLTPAGNVETNLLHPHNIWLEFATNWGSIGLLWLMTLLFFLGKAVRSRDWLVCTLAIALWAACAHAQVDTFSALPDLAAWNWVALGLMAKRTADLG